MVVVIEGNANRIVEARLAARFIVVNSGRNGLVASGSLWWL